MSAFEIHGGLNMSFYLTVNWSPEVEIAIFHFGRRQMNCILIRLLTPVDFMF